MDRKITRTNEVFWGGFIIQRQWGVNHKKYIKSEWAKKKRKTMLGLNKNPQKEY